jgi:putative ABC transport system substrate-binding protein
MRRRQFLGGVGAAAVVGPRGAGGQQSDRVRQIGVLMNFGPTDQAGRAILGAFQQQLQSLGWNDGQNVRLEERYAAGDAERTRAYATELVGMKVDVIFCEGTPMVAALQRTSRTIPIIFINANNPIGSGFIASMARPGGNISGFVSFEPAMGGKWLEMLREIAPNVGRVGLVYNPQTHTGQHFQSIDNASRSLAVKLVQLSFPDAAEIERVVEIFSRETNSGLLILPDNTTSLHRDLIVKLAAWYKLPAIYPFRRFIAAGGLAFYGADEKDMARKAAEYADRILKGSKPSDLPVQFSTKFELVINIKAAQMLGLNIAPTLLTRADEVIE